MVYLLDCIIYSSKRFNINQTKKLSPSRISTRRPFFIILMILCNFPMILRYIPAILDFFPVILGYFPVIPYNIVAITIEQIEILENDHNLIFSFLPVQLYPPLHKRWRKLMHAHLSKIQYLHGQTGSTMSNAHS